MCNLYSVTKGEAAIIALTRALRDLTGNLPSMPGVFPDYSAPIVRNTPDGMRELAILGNAVIAAGDSRCREEARPEARAKGKAVKFDELLRMEADGGTTNIRNIDSKHWKRW